MQVGDNENSWSKIIYHSALTIPSRRIHNFLRDVAVFNSIITNDDVTLS